MHPLYCIRKTVPVWVFYVLAGNSEWLTDHREASGQRGWFCWGWWLFLMWEFWNYITNETQYMNSTLNNCVTMKQSWVKKIFCSHIQWKCAVMNCIENRIPTSVYLYLPQIYCVKSFVSLWVWKVWPTLHLDLDPKFDLDLRLTPRTRVRLPRKGGADPRWVHRGHRTPPGSGRSSVPLCNSRCKLEDNLKVKKIFQWHRLQNWLFSEFLKCT